MSYPVLYVPENTTFYLPFATYGKTNGESITLTGLAVTDIEIYKNGSVTQRASDNGYTLLDTDGIDFDGITGIHGFSIDLSNNSDAGFYEVGAWYFVVVSTVTVDSQTISFIAGMFRIMESENSTGVPDVNVTHWNGTPVATPTVAGVPETDVTHFGGVGGSFTAGRAEVNTTHLLGTSISAASGVLGVNLIQISGDASAADAFEAMLDGTGGVDIFADLAGVVGGISDITFPTNFAIMSINEFDGAIDTNVTKVVDITVGGAGTVANPWGPE